VKNKVSDLMRHREALPDVEIGRPNGNAIPRCSTLYRVLKQLAGYSLRKSIVLPYM
jgi:hypothetical protein